MAKRPRNAEARQRQKDESDPHKQALARYDRALQRERDNIDMAYEDLAFYAGTQWPQELLSRREMEDRPALTFNRLPQFVHQVTGDIRQMRPAIKVVGIDDGADDDTAEILAGMMRYIENRSDASHVYPAAADSQVTCGVGCWRVNIEYADESTYNKEIAIELVEDPVSVLFDPDAVHPTRKDGMFAFEPVDMTRSAFNEMFPDAQASSVDPMNIKSAPVGWFSEDVVRVAKYWYKVPSQRRLCIDGPTVTDVTDNPEKEAELSAKGLQIVTRPGFAVKMRYMTGLGFVTPVDQDGDVVEWPGRYIPLVPVFGEETRIGRKRVRWGLVRAMKDPQRLYNFMRSAQAEIVALQPKAPFMGTEKNFRDNEGLWQTANTKAHAYLVYTPDGANGNRPPERVQPPVSSQGLSEEVASAENDLRNVTGIYNASLGAPSNETSGVAIQKRQQEGDTGTFLYIKNFSLGVAHGARVILDLIPHVYDTERTIRLIGEDGKVDKVKINQPQGLQAEPGAVDDDMAKDIAAMSRIQNDVTVGAYDIHLEMGPSYTTKRSEMRDGMQTFMQTAPNAAPMVLDIFAKAQDWPMADKIAKRLHHMLPPQIQQEEAREQNDPSLAPPPAPPNPAAEAEAAKAQAEVAKVRLEVEGKQLDNLRREFEVLKAQTDLAAKGPPIDSNSLHMLLGHMDEALQFIGAHIAGQGGMPLDGPPPGMPPDMPPPDMMPPDMGPPPGAPPMSPPEQPQGPM